MPLSAEVTLNGIYTLTVTFSQQLQAGASAPGNWYYDLAGQRYVNAMPMTIAGSQVSGELLNAGAGAAGPTCGYLATPADVVNTDGTPAAAFADFPTSGP